MADNIKTIKKVCECKNCGNEAEMTITCSLDDLEEQQESTAAAPSDTDEKQLKKPIRGHATCSHCGGEADMWIDNL